MEAALDTVLPQADLRVALLELLGEAQVDGARRTEVADARRNKALVAVEPCHELRDHEVEIGEAVPVAVADHVDGHAVDEEGDVGPVVRVEPAEEVLVRLAAARVLHGEEPGDRLEDVARPQPRPELGLPVSDGDARRGLAARPLRLDRDLDRGVASGAPAPRRRRGVARGRARPHRRRGVAPRAAAAGGGEGAAGVSPSARAGPRGGQHHG